MENTQNTQEATPTFSPIQPARVIGYNYRGVVIDGGKVCSFRAINSFYLNCRSDKMTADQAFALIDAHILNGSNVVNGCLTVAEFIDHRMIKGN